MVTIKLKRIGTKKKPFYNLIAIERLSHINGKYLDKLGYYDPIKKDTNTYINVEKIKTWVKKGAVLSKRVTTLIKYYNKNV